MGCGGEYGGGEGGGVDGEWRGQMSLRRTGLVSTGGQVSLKRHGESDSPGMQVPASVAGNGGGRRNGSFRGCSTRAPVPPQRPLQGQPYPKYFFKHTRFNGGIKSLPLYFLLQNNVVPLAETRTGMIN